MEVVPSKFESVPHVLEVDVETGTMSVVDSDGDVLWVSDVDEVDVLRLACEALIDRIEELERIIDELRNS